MEFVYAPGGPRSGQPMQRKPFIEWQHDPTGRGGSDTRHFEHKHVSKKWRLDLADEARLGLAPPPWSTTSMMNDPRPNGQSSACSLADTCLALLFCSLTSVAHSRLNLLATVFDARWHNTPMGRARGGRSITWDARGTTHAGATVAAKSYDSVSASNANAEMTNKSAQVPTPCSSKMPPPLSSPFVSTSPLPDSLRLHRPTCPPLELLAGRLLRRVL